jgi:hypothetical protein
MTNRTRGKLKIKIEKIKIRVHSENFIIKNVSPREFGVDAGTPSLTQRDTEFNTLQKSPATAGKLRAKSRKRSIICNGQ